MTETSSFVVSANTEVNAETIRQALEADQNFQAQPQYVRVPVFEMALGIPTALVEWLDKPATLENVGRAKIAFLRHCLENGFIEKTVAAAPSELIAVSGLSPEEFEMTMRDSLKLLVEGGDDLVDQMVEQMKDQGMDDTELIQENPELPESVKKAYLEGWLTVGKMLLLHPNSIICADSNQD
jgi:hypothetical protein